MYGPADEYDCLSRGMLSPGEVRERISDLKEYVSSLRDAGVELVIPYICSMFMFGDARERSGFWGFYDSWDRYSEFGFGRKPDSDPVTWSYQRPRHLGFDRVKNLDGRYVYEPCINHPDWRRFLRTVVSHIAGVGYDGVFVDVNASACTKPLCRSLFTRYLEGKYTERQIHKLFNFGSRREVKMGRSGDGLLWAETVKFRGERMADLFHELENEGRKYRDEFIVLPNLSPYQHVDGVMKRVGISHVLSAWARECPLVMFEEMQQPGCFGRRTVSNFTFQYKYALAETTLPGCLLYNSQDREGVEISMAEAFAGGGGCFIQGGYSCPDVRNSYMKFLSENPGLFEGLESHAQLGLVFLYDQLSWGSRTHIVDTYRVAEELMASHVLFDLVVERGLEPITLGKYTALLACGLGHLSPGQHETIMDYVKSGGTVIAIGDYGWHDRKESNKRRKFRSLGKKNRRGIIKERIGRGNFIHIDKLERLLTPPAFELFGISEEDSLNTERIIEMVENSSEGNDRQRELVPRLVDWTAIHPVSNCEETLRFNAFLAKSGSDLKVILHAINYSLPITGRARSGIPVPSSRTRVSLPIPGISEVHGAELFKPPEKGTRELEYELGDEMVTIVLPSVRIYSIARISAGS
jgi:hypothetical protein